MDILEYREAIKRTMNCDLTPQEKLAMLSLGTAGETGEVVDTIKKHVFHGHELDREHLEEELGDVFWYLFNLMNEFGISHEKVFIKNVMKLNKRYKNGFSQEDSRNRVI